MRLALQICVGLAIITLHETGAESNLDKDTKIFYTCDGQPTAAKEYTKVNLVQFTPCFAGVTKPKYCQYKCSLAKLGFISDTGSADYANTQKIFKQYNFFGAHNDEVLAAVKECADGKTFTTEENNCKSVREFYYCFYNKYNKICKSGQQDLDVSKTSQESNVVGRVSGSASLLTDTMGVGGVGV